LRRSGAPSQVADGAFGLIRGEVQRVRVFFDDRVARFVRRRRWHPTQQIRNVSGGIELTMDVAGTLEVANWILGFGEKAIVLEPAELRAQVAAELRHAANRYAGN
jgi:predicted DNA-binding transcriptional regulator YafY